MAEIRNKDTGAIIVPTLEGITNLACTNGSISKSNVTAVSIATYDPNAGHITLRVTTSASITNNNIYRLGLYTETTFVIANEL